MITTRARGLANLHAAAITLYESIGFKVYGREHCALIVDGVPYDDVLMDIQL